MPLKEFPLHDVILGDDQTTADWVCADAKENVYVKEAIYEGDFLLPGDVPLSVDGETISHWASSVTKMVENGVKIPLPEGHTTKASSGRGEVLGAYAGLNKEGKKALYVRTKFNDAETAEKYKNTQVSIFSPPEFTDGKGNKYVRPITHVALTDYPVIPGLQGFQSIAASFVTEKHKEISMPLKELATRLNIQCENDGQLEDTIVLSFQKKDEDHAAALKSKDDEITALKAKLPADPIAVTAGHKTMLRDNRLLKLDRLVGEHISPAVKDGLVDIFCSEDALTLSLSTEAGDGGLFDKIIAVLEKNETVKLGDQTEIVALSQEDMTNPEKNPLIADAQRRAEAAKRQAS